MNIIDEKEEPKPKKVGRKKKEQDDKRDHRVYVRFTNDEFKIVEQLKSDHKLPASELLRNALFKYDRKRKDERPRVEVDLVVQLNKLGNNINQIARNSNATKDVSIEHLHEFKAQYDELIKLLGEIMTRL